MQKDESAKIPATEGKPGSGRRGESNTGASDNGEISFDIAILPGDGIGPEVIDAALVLLKMLERKWSKARRAVSGVEAITRTAQGISGGTFEKRVPVKDRGDEIDQLAMTFNQMLDRIQSLVALASWSFGSCGTSFLCMAKVRISSRSVLMAVGCGKGRVNVLFQ